MEKQGGKERVCRFHDPHNKMLNNNNATSQTKGRKPSKKSDVCPILSSIGILRFGPGRGMMNGTGRKLEVAAAAASFACFLSLGHVGLGTGEVYGQKQTFSLIANNIPPRA